MSKTRDKLKEARFFLQKLEDYYTQQPDFDYYLSAYISSSRSVIWLMRNEYSNVKGWKEWYDSKEPTLEEIFFLKNVNNVRVRSVKKEPLQTKTQLSAHIDKKDITPEIEEAIETLVGKNVKVTFTPVKDTGEKQQPKISRRSITFLAKLNELIRVVKEFPDQDVLAICHKYYDMLRTLVDECEQLFQLG